MSRMVLVGLAINALLLVEVGDLKLKAFLNIEDTFRSSLTGVDSRIGLIAVTRRGRSWFKESS